MNENVSNRRESSGRKNYRYVLFDSDVFPYLDPVTKC